MTTEQMAVLGMLIYVTTLAFFGFLGLREACGDQKRSNRRPTGCGELW